MTGVKKEDISIIGAISEVPGIIVRALLVKSEFQLRLKIAALKWQTKEYGSNICIILDTG